MKYIPDIKYLFEISSIMSKLDDKIIIKGALLLNSEFISRYDTLARLTRDIDMSYNGTISELLNTIEESVLLSSKPNIRIKLDRINSISCKIILIENNNTIEIDIQFKSIEGTSIYSVGENAFKGQNINNILSDKILVISTPKLARRVKDLYDLYLIINMLDIDINSIKASMQLKNQTLGDFYYILDYNNNTKQGLRYAYTKFVETGTTQLVFDYLKVIEHTLLFLKPFIDGSDKHLLWDYRNKRWMINGT